jgi:CRISPR-associated protein Csd2
MNDDICADPTLRHDFVLLFDVTDGNPNGDPDAGNLPRVDPETMQGLVTDVCLKRKVRNWVDATQGGTETRKIYVQNQGIALNDLHQRAYTALRLKSTGAKQKREDVEQARKWMCQNFYDIRLFGAVMTTNINCGQVRGPAQLTFARSLDPVVALDLSITRVAVTRPEDAKEVSGEDGAEKGGKTTEMGRKALLPYALFRGHGFFTPHFAHQTGVTKDDLAVFWQALRQMWDLDRSASRGLAALRGLYVFSHANPFGNAPAHELFSRIVVTRLPNVETPRRFSDYEVLVNQAERVEGAPVDLPLPEGVTLTRLVG